MGRFENEFNVEEEKELASYVKLNKGQGKSNQEKRKRFIRKKRC